MGKELKKMPTGTAVLIAATLALTAIGSMAATTAHADSCWDHNGSTMRLKAQGNQRWFYYERPRSVLRAAGVRRGTLLFNGRKSGNRYTGTARRFSKYCPSPLEYYVEGPVSSTQTRVTIRGTREVFAAGCRNTGRTKSDKLVFTFSHQC